jgi:dTDP-4-amino-4,6-dideoxygalactose transaminase
MNESSLSRELFYLHLSATGQMNIPFNKPYLPGPFARNSRRIFSGDDILRTLGPYYQSCYRQLKEMYGVEDLVLTPSCTAALELAAQVLDIQPGDEVILPSFTYVSTANAFVLRGAVPVFVDCYPDSVNMNVDEVEAKITSRTKAIVVVHYSGVARNLEKLVRLKKKHKLFLVEDAAHAIGAEYKGRLLGTSGDLSTFSFHETKNISCGQGGALMINNKKLADKAHVISQCGTNRQDFIRKKTTAYTWISTGSNYLLAEPLCAALDAGLKQEKKITKKRSEAWKYYYGKLKKLHGKIQLPAIEKDSPGNGHIFHFFAQNKKDRDALIRHLATQGITAAFHYQPLHESPFYTKQYAYIKESLPHAEKAGGTILRLPMFYALTRSEQDRVIRAVSDFFGG